MYTHLPLPDWLSFSCTELMALRRKHSLTSLDIITEIKQEKSHRVVVDCFGLAKLAVSEKRLILMWHWHVKNLTVKTLFTGQLRHGKKQPSSVFLKHGMSLSFYNHRQHQMITNNWNREIFRQLGSEEGVSGKVQVIWYLKTQKIQDIS